MKILLVEDDVNLREVVQRSLEKERYIVEVAPDFRTGIQKIEDYTYDCILLDIMLPDGNGLELGADDYLPKPFHLAELNARIKSVIRRNQQNGEITIKYGNIEVFPDKYRVQVDGKELDLNRKEYDILVYFMNRPGRLVNKNTMAESVWGDHIDQVDNFDFIYAQIKNLRKHLKEAGATPEVKAVYGLGYKMTMD